MHDAWARLDSRRVDPNVKPLEQSHATLLPGVGHAWLGRGKGEHQVQVHLHFSGAYGHAHADNLNLMLFARGAGTALRCGLYPYPIPKLDSKHLVSQYCVDR